MRNILIALIAISFFTSLLSCQSEAKTIKKEQSYMSHQPTTHHMVAMEVLDASANWIENFNKANSIACLQGYHTMAVMNAIPFGIKRGHEEISGFWTPFIESGAGNLIYTNVKIQVADEKTAFLSANWSMNIGRGIIYQEKWEKKNNQWLLTYDNFQVLEQFAQAKENNTKPTASHMMLKDIIQASKQWIIAFNSAKGNICGDSYSDNAYMNAIPFASIEGKKKIKNFWTQLISDGAKHLIYHQPSFEITSDKTALLSADWSMNIGEGKIYQEKWEMIKHKWKLSYDEFQVTKQY